VPLFEVVHRTTYRYAQPVAFGQHRAMLRPRDSHDLRLHDARLIITPSANVGWLHDVFSNSIVLLDFLDPATELMVESRLLMERFESLEDLGPPRGQVIDSFPFDYPKEMLLDLGGCERRHYADPGGKVARWARRFLRRGGDSATLLAEITQAIKDEFAYRPRWEVGTQQPSETLARKSGTCRDYALFMMEAVRSLGFAARFVHGYLYDPAMDGQDSGMRGAGATHAWVQVFLPLSGWVEYDPTNALIGGRNLIRVAVARDPLQAIPLSGSYEGTLGDFLGMEVDVQVRTVSDAAAWGQPGTATLPVG